MNGQHDTRELSKRAWDSVQGATFEAINVGSFQRIADAIEKMSGSYSSLIADRDYYKRTSEDYHRRLKRRDKQIAAYRGIIKRLKKGGAS